MGKRLKHSFRIDNYGFPLRKKKRGHWKIKLFIAITVFIVAMLILTFSLQNLIINMLTQSIDIQAPSMNESLISFWGSIIGGIISGLLTLVGVIITINYYRQSDEEKIRKEYMPFLVGELCEIDKKEIEEYSQLEEFSPHNIKKCTLCDSPKDYNIYTKKDVKAIFMYKLKLTNLGQGIATHLKVSQRKYSDYIDFLSIGDSTEVLLEVVFFMPSRSIVFTFSCEYKDIMLNEYYQEFLLEYSDDGKHVTFHNNSYPILRENTSDKEYEIVGESFISSIRQRMLFTKHFICHTVTNIKTKLHQLFHKNS